MEDAVYYKMYSVLSERCIEYADLLGKYKALTMIAIQELKKAKIDIEDDTVDRMSRLCEEIDNQLDRIEHNITQNK